MSLRAISSLLTRRFSPLGNPSAQAVSSLGIGVQKRPPGSAAGRSALSFHTLRDLSVGDGVSSAALPMGAFVGLVAAALYLNKNTQNSADDVTGEDTGMEIVKEPYLSREAAIKAGFVGKDGRVNWPEYYDSVNSQRHNGGMLFYKEVYVKEVSDVETVKQQEDVNVDEATLKARFEDWIKEYGRSYRTEEEKARRYETFKKTAIHADKYNASKRNGARTAAPNGFADWTDEECKSSDIDFDWETYVDHINNMAAHGWCIVREQSTVSEAVKQRFKEQARQAEEKCGGDKS